MCWRGGTFLGAWPVLRCEGERGSWGAPPFPSMCQSWGSPTRLPGCPLENKAVLSAASWGANSPPSASYSLIRISGICCFLWRSVHPGAVPFPQPKLLWRLKVPCSARAGRQRAGSLVLCCRARCAAGRKVPWGSDLPVRVGWLWELAVLGWRQREELQVPSPAWCLSAPSDPTHCGGEIRCKAP